MKATEKMTLRRHLLPRQSMADDDLQVLWRIEKGAIRIDSQTGDEPASFVRLALPGDLLGVEHFVGVSDTLTIRAITEVSLSPVSYLDDRQLTKLLMSAVSTSYQRCREAVSLRSGPVDERVKRLLRLLAEESDTDVNKASSCVLPSLGNIAEIIHSTRETVCRVLNSLKEARLLAYGDPEKMKRRHLENREHLLQLSA
ncbi:Crp/Fnr family transcriptional regulator [Undibacterium sp. Dicai25W]|uniref:Crp/Fnr family transcriptional regulator n=1 Tax=Undibacterium sp. Dicai25W TaxID=3413034 RepID=UPI003BF1F7F4